MASGRAGRADWRQPARIAIVGGIAYIALNLAISQVQAGRVRSRAPDLVAAVPSPVPVAFWQREVLWRDAAGRHGKVGCGLLACEQPFAPGQPSHMDDPRIRQRAQGNADAQAFLFWSRMPFARPQADGAIVLGDQRFDGAMARGSFVLRLEL